MAKRHLAKNAPKPRKGQGDVDLTREEFSRRFRERFTDPAFAPFENSIAQLTETAWQAYADGRKSPRTAKAGRAFFDPSYDLAIEWLETRNAIARAQKLWKSRRTRTRVLLVCASARNDQTCPGEMSKTYRMTQIARKTLMARHIEVDHLDLSLLTAQYGRKILPCKACVSTAMPLCHWPCSCYPNYSLGQTEDWMNELYPRFVAAHGLMIITPVYWYQAPSVLKLLMDRLVCADGGNPDPTTTQGKDAGLAKAIEMKGWDFPRHLAGRAYAVVVHGDSAGTEGLRRSLCDWLNDMHLVPSGAKSALDRYIDYYGKYATSHEKFDEDHALHEEIRHVALALADKVAALRRGITEPGDTLEDPRPK